MKKRVIFLVGPTAIGKTEIAIKLAKKINAEIISCDSMQIYKGMDIISAKPPNSVRKKITHHLIDITSPRKEYDVMRYQKDALRKIKLIHKKDKLPLIVGGSGFYMSALLDGIFKGAGRNKSLRNRLYQEAKIKGADYLYNRLKKLDKIAAKKIHPNDLRRIVRALEVVITTGIPISRLQRNRKGVLDNFEVKVFGLRENRAELYNQIDKRVDIMFKKGLVSEAMRLLSNKLNKTAAQAIGIEEIRGFLDGKYDLDEAKRLIKRNSRRYAKRQFTWFNKDKRIEWVDVDNRHMIDLVKEILVKLNLDTRY